MNSLKTWFKKIGNYLIPKNANLGLQIPALADISTVGLGVDTDGKFVQIVALNGDSYQGEIAVNTDFPLIAAVTAGDWYSITANVTDDAGVLYTNTGQSFASGDTIYWTGTEWKLYYNTSSNTTKYIDYANNLATFVTTPIALTMVKGDIVRVVDGSYGSQLWFVINNTDPTSTANYWQLYSYGKIASGVVTNTTNFNNLLSVADINVQLALNTLNNYIPAIGCTLKVGTDIEKGLCGIKNYIATTEIITIPQYYEYNTFILDVDGTVNNNGTINFL